MVRVASNSQHSVQDGNTERANEKGEKAVSTRSVRRIGEQERTQSWAQSQLQADDEDRLLKPPSQEPTRRASQICTFLIL